MGNAIPCDQTFADLVACLGADSSLRDGVDEDASGLEQHDHARPQIPASPMLV